MPASAPEKRHSSFKGDVIRLATGTGLAQLIGLIAAPILTRLYAPEAYGTAALFTSITSILGVLACMRYELSIVLPDDDSDAANMLLVSIGSAFLVSIITIPIIGLGGPILLHWLKTPELKPYLWLIPPIVLVNGIYTGLNYWNTRTKSFTRLSISRVTSQIATTACTLGAGLAGYATGGTMITAGIGGQVVATSVLGGQIWSDNGRFILGNASWQKMWMGVKRYRRFPLISGWGALINTASWQLPILMLGVFFSPVVVGFYAFGFRLIQLPMSLIGGAISQVFFQRGAVAKGNQDLAHTVESLFEKMLIIGVLPTLILTIVGADLFSFVFGASWHEAGVYTQMLAPWALLWFMSSPLSTVYVILEKQKQELAVHSLIFVVRIIGICLGGFIGSPRLAVAFFSFGGVIAYGYLLNNIFKYSELKLSKVIDNNIRNVLLAAFATLPLLVSKLFIPSSTYLIMCVTICTLIVYFYSNRNILKSS